MQQPEVFFKFLLLGCDLMEQNTQHQTVSAQNDNEQMKSTKAN
jgi:hypothetical protein